jgi:phosphatidylglycerophosphate synthase
MALGLARKGVRPNLISGVSLVFAGLAGVGIIFGPRLGTGWGVGLLVAAAAFIQLRLLCNLLDGMVAVEGGLGTRSGEIFNDFPDRLSDATILVSAGYSISWVTWGSELGWAAALLAVITAYVRVLGGSAGAIQYFCGPMAKQQRMAVITAACLLATAEVVLGWGGYVITLALGIIAIGCIITIARRTYLIVKELESR